jgi:hypothetical protein
MDTFSASIHAFVADAESHPGCEYTIPRLLSRFGFQKRRFYDVMCVLSTIGCCEKRSIDSVYWFGTSRIPLVFQRLQLDASANRATATLDSIIGSQDTVSIAPLTIQLMLCFLVLQMETLDIRHIARYLSRHTLRHKSTLCKLYQITHILEAAGIIRRSDIPGRVTIVAKFFAPLEIDTPSVTLSEYSIGSLLNHPRSKVGSVLKARRDDFFAVIGREDEEIDESDSQ